MTPARLAAHLVTFGHSYILKRRPDNGKAFCSVCRSKRNTADWVQRYAMDPEFHARHNATALKSVRKKKSSSGSKAG